MALPVHDAVSRGFTANTISSYEAGRPEWGTGQFEAALRAIGVLDEAPDAAGRFPAKACVEIGPGTGKSTRPLYAVLQQRCAPGAAPNLVLVEPTELCAGLAEALPGATLLKAMAEDMAALPSGSARVVVCAQAFHWFANEASLREIHRVLAPGGHLVLAWNTRDAGGGPAVAALEAVINDVYAADPTPTPRQHSGAWRAPFATFKSFSPIQHLSLPKEGGAVAQSEESVVDWAMSISVVAKLPPERRAEVAAAVRAVVQRPDFPRGAEPGTVRVPMATDFYWVQKTTEGA
jgi:SAM-dependent methyltransferase